MHKLADGFVLDKLNLQNKEALAQMFAKASDYAQLESGISDPKKESLAVLTDLPAGKSQEDKEVLGVFNPQGELVGVVDLVRDFPQKSEWMLGLLELIPEARGKGLGKNIHAALVKKVLAGSGKSLRIGVLQVNLAALNFWKSLGYEKIGHTQQTFGEKVQEIEILRLNLK